MIIWIASYPKSGNTWLRAFITSLLYKDKNLNVLNKLKQIHAYPLSKDFYNLLDNFENFKNISENWEKSQSILNLDKKIKFLKTHHILCSINGKFFTNYKNSLGVIYIVRDPRNVIISLKHHYSFKNYDEALKFMLDKHRFSGKMGKKETFTRETEFPTYISNWHNHYNSWKNFKKNYLLIKYEDLIKNPKVNFKEVTKYLSKLLKIKIDEEDLDDAILKSSFKNLKQSEEKFGFSEAAPDKITNRKKKFFNLGPDNMWEEDLPVNIRKKIESTFNEEMKELNYL
tara:strand:- start:526 stop:1380 length:855 start_codon:yes stop_codon:yes gene_type:complete